MNENGNLHNGIGIQMGQVKTIEIKEAAEKGRRMELGFRWVRLRR
jgi:hypothetical protein